MIHLRLFTYYPIPLLPGRSFGAAVLQVDRRLFVFTSPKNISDAFHPKGRFARSKGRTFETSIVPDSTTIQSAAAVEVMFIVLVFEIVFDVNHRHGRTHKHWNGRILFLV